MSDDITARVEQVEHLIDARIESISDRQAQYYEGEVAGLLWVLKLLREITSPDPIGPW